MICLARAFIGLTGTRIYSHDTFALLDPAWRILNGQIPHADFFDSLGPAAYLPTVAGLLLAGGKAEGFGCGQALCALSLGFWSYLISRDRLSDAGRLLFCLVVVSSAAAPFALGDSPFLISPATTYNRYGYAFTALILLEGIMEPKDKRAWAEMVGGVSTGAVLVLLLFLKITFFIGAALLVAVLAACRPQARVRWNAMLLGFVATMLLFSAYLRFDLRPMWQDFAMLAGAKHINPADYMIESILESAGLLFVFTVSAALFLLDQNRSKQARTALISGAAVCLAGLLFIFTSYERAGFPLQAILPILVVDLLTARIRVVSRLEKTFLFSILLWAGALILTSLVPNAVSLSYGVAHKIRINHRYEPMHSPALSRFIPIQEDQAYQLFVNDGIALLKQYRRLGDSVMSLDFTNPFSYGLAMKPARGGAICLQYRTTFDDAHKPSPEWLFGYATLVMVPKQFSDGTLDDSIPRLYGPYLRDHFSFVSESAQWRLYRNRLNL
ncbi:MAG: hypothetical protein M3Z09_16200 [Acidobacteriota bacterium]|nr:hypothetical protein [Acidobacteriota bacterium]